MSNLNKRCSWGVPTNIKRTVHGQIFTKLDKLTGGIVEFAATPGNTKKLKSGGYMDLTIECLDTNRISLTHYYRQNGDLIADPDVEVSINPEMGTAEALTYQDARIYQVVYPSEGMVYPELKKKLNTFLNQWLRNLKNQGFYS